MKHAGHQDIRNRLKRTEGHLRKVIDMIEQDQPCLDITQQLHAVERAVHAAKTALIHAHVDHCLAGAAADQDDRDSSIAEFREITRYL